MAPQGHSQQPDDPCPGVSRRDATRWLAFAIAGLSATDLAGQRAPAAGADRKGPAPVTFLDAASLRRAIRGAPEETPGQPGLYSRLLAGPGDYPVIGIRRTAPTRSERHADFTDVWYVLEGSATLVTGGTIVGGVGTGPGETRGRTIAGGDRRAIRPGDFAVIPAGTPHWISQVGAGDLLYLVVKVPLPK